MDGIFRWSLLTTCCIIFCFCFSADVPAQPLKMTSSTQFLWGDDWNGDSQTTVAQYLRFSYQPEGSRISLAGYGRIWYDFGNTQIRESDQFLGSLYYLYLDVVPFENTLLRLGRHYTNFSAGSSLLDGMTVSIQKLGPVPLGITASAGLDITTGLDTQYERLGNYFVGVDLHLVDVKQLQLGVSYTLKYDEWDTARQELGAHFRFIHRYFSPYAEARYDFISETIDEATVGIDLFPLSNLMLKGEFYHSYPTFDSTSIYSVFAVDKYQEYLVRAEYSLEAPVTLFASYAHQTYEDDDDGDNFIVGARFFPVKDLTLSISGDYRNGFGGNLWGFEVTGDYKVMDKLLLSAGAQYNYYKRPDIEEEDFHTAQRYWIGARYLAKKDLSFIARIEDNINVNFHHRPLGRIALNWNL